MARIDTGKDSYALLQRELLQLDAPAEPAAKIGERTAKRDPKCVTYRTCPPVKAVPH